MGLAIIALGIYVWYVYITSFINEGNHSLFALSMIQIGVGVYILFKASKSNTEQLMPSDDMGMPIKLEQVKSGGILQRNADLMKDWHKTADLKDKLSVLKEAAKDQEKTPYSG